MQQGVEVGVAMGLYFILSAHTYAQGMRGLKAHARTHVTRAGRVCGVACGRLTGGALRRRASVRIHTHAHMRARALTRVPLGVCAFDLFFVFSV